MQTNLMTENLGPATLTLSPSRRIRVVAPRTNCCQPAEPNLSSLAGLRAGMLRSQTREEWIWLALAVSSLGVLLISFWL
jgi:hypothetical protein